MWFEQPVDDRILAWRKWRNSLESLPEEDVIKCVAETWARVPTVLHYLVPDQVNNWPNPWQLITDNVYCDLGICLGMYYTLVLIESPKITNLTIQIYRTPEGWLNLSSVDYGKYVLNYNHGAVVNKSCVQKDQLDLVFEYSEIDLCNKFN
jgi:hypothetical protein